MMEIKYTIHLLRIQTNSYKLIDRNELTYRIFPKWTRGKATPIIAINISYPQPVGLNILPPVNQNGEQKPNNRALRSDQIT